MQTRIKCVPIRAINFRMRSGSGGHQKNAPQRQFNPRAFSRAAKILEPLILVRIQVSVARNLSSPAQRSTPAAPETGAVSAGPAPSDIRSALDRLRKSRTIGSSERLVEFLNFVVEASLNGEHLKETTIGVSVFGCTTDYDPKADAIVRSQAWRLRLKLKEYYAHEGADDPLVIDLPKGHYVPVFSVRKAREEWSENSSAQRQHPRRV